MLARSTHDMRLRACLLSPTCPVTRFVCSPPQWVLSDWVFYGGVIFFVTTGLMSYALAITEADLFDTDHRNGFATARATWWQIPDEYQAPTGGTPAPLCQCLQCFEDKITGKGTSTAACTGCSVAYNTDCLADPECVAACSPAQMLSGEFGDSCTSYFEKFLASGACGFPSQRVDESSVVVSATCDHIATTRSSDNQHASSCFFPTRSTAGPRSVRACLRTVRCTRSWPSSTCALRRPWSGWMIRYELLLHFMTSATVL